MEIDIDFIKWLCAKTGNFGCFKDGDDYIVEHHSYAFCLDSMLNKDPDWHCVYYPLLLQRAVEGVNHIGNYEIVIHEGFVDIRGSEQWETLKIIIHNNRFDSIDKAKESALKYVYEQEEGK